MGFQVAVLAYVASRGQGHARIKKLVHGYDQSAMYIKEAATLHLTSSFSLLIRDMQDASRILDQPKIMKDLHTAVFEDMVESGSDATQVRLRVSSAVDAGTWLQHVPSPTRDVLFSRCIFGYCWYAAWVHYVRGGRELHFYCVHALDPCGHHI